MNLFHSMKFVRSFQCTEWHAKSAVCETTVYTRIVSHSELNWECILNSNSSPECMSELVLSCRWLGIVSPGSEVSWEQQMRLWKLRAGRSDACCELSSSVYVCVGVTESNSVCFSFLSSSAVSAMLVQYLRAVLPVPAAREAEIKPWRMTTGWCVRVHSLTMQMVYHPRCTECCHNDQIPFSMIPIQICWKKSD